MPYLANSTDTCQVHDLLIRLGKGRQCDTDAMSIVDSTIVTNNGGAMAPLAPPPPVSTAYGYSVQSALLGTLIGKCARKLTGTCGLGSRSIFSFCLGPGSFDYVQQERSHLCSEQLGQRRPRPIRKLW